MNPGISSIVERILQERDRQRSLPGSEFDSENSVNDWVSIAAMYLTEPANRKWVGHWGGASNSSEFEDSLIKAAAVIVAALEHTAHLKQRGELK